MNAMRDLIGKYATRTDEIKDPAYMRKFRNDI